MGAATKPLVAGIKNYITAGLIEVFGKKGRLKRTETAIITRQSNKAAKALNLTPAEAQKALRDAVKAPTPPKKKAGTFTPKKPNPQSTKGKGSKGSNKGLTPAERKEKASLIRENRADQRGTLKQKGDAPGGRQRTLIPVPGSKNRQRIVADPQNKLKGSQQFSKAELENMNEAEKLEYRLKGIGGQSGTMKARSGKGSMDEQSKKYGGKVKRNMGGKVYRRGGGKALRGFGKATYSNKMY